MPAVSTVIERTRVDEMVYVEMYNRWMRARDGSIVIKSGMTHYSGVVQDLLDIVYPLGLRCRPQCIHLDQERVQGSVQPCGKGAFDLVIRCTGAVQQGSINRTLDILSSSHYGRNFYDYFGFCKSGGASALARGPCRIGYCYAVGLNADGGIMTDVDNPKDRRVKVYQLNGDGQWDDKGTGQIVLSGVPEEQTFEMSVSCEDTNAQLMEHRVVREVDYARQGETIITWCQADNPDLALSFQEAAGCSDVWNKIVAVIGQRDDQDSNGTLQGGHQVEPIQLPEPRLENVESILKVIAESPTNNRELVASALLQDDYLKKLLDVFEQVDQSGDSKTAILFFELFKQTVLLNEISIYEVLFSDEIFKPMLSVFDHDPTMREENKMQHRTFWSRAQFKPIMDIKDQSLVKKIHQNYRMTYFKDVVLLRFLDDCALNTLGSLIYYNNATIISHITEHPELVGSIFKKINEAALSIRNFVDSKDSKGDQKGSPSDCLAKDPFLFMQELCGIVKNLQVPQRDAFYNTLVEASVFQSVEDALWAAAPRDYPWVWQSSVEILQNMLIHDSALMRSFLVSRIPSDRSLLARLVTMIVSEENMNTGALTHTPKINFYV
eukprot:1391834-Amorphochlora_amoeboformis.AAC.1